VRTLTPHAAAPSWLLLGCGTGVPTVAALKLGVAKVICVFLLHYCCVMF
jgi:hypothetical protein